MNFNHVGLIAKRYSSVAEQTLHNVIAFLQQEGMQITLEEETAKIAKNESLLSADYGELGMRCDLLIVIGGDWTLLNVARNIAPFEVPVVGINRGQLGFLTDINPENFEYELHEMLEGRYREEKRFMLEVYTEQNQQVKQRSFALNEVILTATNAAQMIEFEIYIDDVFMCSQRSDGLIIATPTGSTAYSLSAGGPILHPSLDAVTLIPMFPHALNSRPIVLDGDCHIKLLLPKKIRSLPHIFCDSQLHFKIQRDDTIHINKLEQHLRLLHPMDYDYYKALRSKLEWGKRLDFNHK